MSGARPVWDCPADDAGSPGALLLSTSGHKRHLEMRTEVADPHIVTVVEMNLAGSADGGWAWGSPMKEVGGRAQAMARPTRTPSAPLWWEGCTYHPKWMLQKELCWGHQERRNQTRRMGINQESKEQWMEGTQFTQACQGGRGKGIKHTRRGRPDSPSG